MLVLVVRIFSIIDPFFEVASITAMFTAITYIRWFHEFRTNFLIIAVTVSGALGASDGAGSLTT
jgi:hypothetical protein